MKLLFWNINRKPLSDEIKWLCDYYDIDIVVLAENVLSDVQLLPILNKETNRTFIAPFNPSSKISFFTRFHKFELVHDDSWGLAKKIIFNNFMDMN